MNRPSPTEPEQTRSRARSLARSNLRLFCEPPSYAYLRSNGPSNRAEMPLRSGREGLRVAATLHLLTSGGAVVRCRLQPQPETGECPKVFRCIPLPRAAIHL